MRARQTHRLNLERNSRARLGHTHFAALRTLLCFTLYVKYMTMPTTSQTTNRIQVMAFNPDMSPSETIMPNIGTKGTNGVLNGRTSSGRRTRRIHTPAQTITNASKVPMLTSCPKSPIGTSAPTNATHNPTIAVDFQ